MSKENEHPPEEVPPITPEEMGIEEPERIVINPDKSQEGVEDILRELGSSAIPQTDEKIKESGKKSEDSRFPTTSMRSGYADLVSGQPKPEVDMPETQEEQEGEQDG